MSCEDRSLRLGVDQALALIRDHGRPLGSERVAVADALGRITSAPVIAARNFPRFAMSAMDGYALRSAETAGAPLALPIGPHARTGEIPPPLAQGHAVPISTGSAIPDGADTILVRERGAVVALDGQAMLHIDAPVLPALNIRQPGEDAARGDSVLPPGSRIEPDSIAALIAYGIAELEVRTLPRLAIFSTGDEIADPAAPLGATQHADSNRPMIEAMAQRLGLSIDRLGHAGETAAENDAMIAAALAADRHIILSTGGVSKGEFDLVRPALERAGATILFHGVAMRPGKPLLVAALPGGRLYFGLPGNPVAALLGFRFFVTAAIRAMLDLPPEQGIPAVVEGEAREGTTVFLRGVLRQGADGHFVERAADQRSHTLRAVLTSDCWARLEVDGAGRRSCSVYPKHPAPLGSD